MFSFHLKVINVNFIVGRAVTQLKEGVSYWQPMQNSKDTLGPAAAPAQLCQGEVRPCPAAGEASLIHIPFGMAQILSLHGAVGSASTAMDVQFSTAEDSSVWKEKGWRQMEPGPVTGVHEPTPAQSHSSFLWFPESQTTFSTNEQPAKATWEQPRLGTCLKGELSIAKLNHIRKCWQTQPE